MLNMTFEMIDIESLFGECGYDMSTVGLNEKAASSIVVSSVFTSEGFLYELET